MASNFDSGFNSVLKSRALRLEERDLKQRSIGCMGFSAFAHITFLVALMISGLFAKTWHQERSRQGAKQARADFAQGAKKPGAKSQARLLAHKDALAETNGKHEVWLADASETNAVALPAQDKTPAVSPKPIVAVTPRSAQIEPPLKTATKPIQKSAQSQLPKKNNTTKQEKRSANLAQNTESTPAGKIADPEMLSPLIAEDPPPGEHALIPAGPSSDELEAASTGGGAGSSTTPYDGTPLDVVDASTRQPLAGNPLPSYPQEDRLNGYQGTTVLIGHVTADGQMLDVKIEKSSGSASLDRASLDAFKNWRFAAGDEAEVRKAIRFSLNGETQVVPARLGSR